MLKVDFFVLGASELDAEQMERRRPAALSEEPARRVYVSSPEDLILRKLAWYRDGRLGLSDLLSRAVDEAGIDEAR